GDGTTGVVGPSPGLQLGPAGGGGRGATAEPCPPATQLGGGPANLGGVPLAAAGGAAGGWRGGRFGHRDAGGGGGPCGGEPAGSGRTAAGPAAPPALSPAHENPRPRAANDARHTKGLPL